MLIFTRAEALRYHRRLARASEMAEERLLTPAADAYDAERRSLEAHVCDTMAVTRIVDLEAGDRIEPPFEPLFPGLVEMPVHAYLKETEQ